MCVPRPTDVSVADSRHEGAAVACSGVAQEVTCLTAPLPETGIYDTEYTSATYCVRVPATGFPRERWFSSVMDYQLMLFQTW